MITEVLVIGSVLFVGGKVHTRRREGETSLTVHAENKPPFLRTPRKNKPLFLRTPRKNKLLFLTTPRKKGGAKEKIDRTRVTLKNLKEEYISPFFSDARDQQFKELSSGQEIEISDAEKKNNRDISIALSSLALTLVGDLFYPPLSLITVPSLLYLSQRLFKRSYQLIFQDNRPSLAIIEATAMLGTLATGHLFAAALYQTLYFFKGALLLKTEDHTTKNLLNVFGRQAHSVWILSDGVEVEVPFETVKKGDIVVVSAGAMIPIDGAIISGLATIDQRMFTGESQPVEKGIGDEVFASTMMLSGRICVQVEKAGSESLAAQIGDILNKTADFKDSVQLRGETLVDQWSWATLGFSALGLLLVNPTSAVAICNVGFGYQLRAAGPISVLNFFQIASQNGILVKDGRSLELLKEVDVIVFDKTGTLTEELPHVGKIYCCLELSENELLTYAAATEQKQTHPIALAILQEAKARGLCLPKVNEAHVEMGYGLKVRIGERMIKIGSQRFMAKEGITIPANILEIQEHCHQHGYSLVYMALDGLLAGAIELHPTIRPEAKRIIGELRKRNCSIYIISGDHETPTRKLAAELGIDHYFAETMPENKADLITELQQAGKSVCFVGDGINDSIALRCANVSVSLCGASTIATDTASIVLMDGTLKQLPRLFEIADELDANLNSSLIISLLPGFLGVGGVFFLHWGIVTTVLLYNVSLGASVLNAMLPLIKHQRNKAKKPVIDTQNSSHAHTLNR